MNFLCCNMFVSCDLTGVIRSGNAVIDAQPLVWSARHRIAASAQRYHHLCLAISSTCASHLIMPLIQGGRKPISSRIHANRQGDSDASQVSKPHTDAATGTRVTNTSDKDEQRGIEDTSGLSTGVKDEVDITDVLQGLDKDTLIELLSQACQEHPSLVSRVLQVRNQTA